MLRKKDAIIFDLDGTLIDSMWMWKTIDIEYLGRYGIEVPDSLQKEIEGLSFHETAVYFKEHFLLEDSLEDIQSVWLEMAEYKYRYEVPLKDGVLEFLQYARKNGKKMAIASSNSKELVEATLISHQIREYFDEIVTCDEVAHSKPAPDVYLRAAQLLQVSPARCLVFEDILHGIQAGKAAGMTTYAVHDAYTEGIEKEKREAADGYIYDYSELVPKYDFIYVLGDVYVDHPSFGAAIIKGVLERNGYTVAVISQPDWTEVNSIKIYGEPRLGFLVSSGNMDSMVNHYTVAKKRRSTDAYSPRGEAGHRPDRAVIVYSNLIRQAYKHTPIIIGGIEASLRRMAHYDYWSNTVKRSILLDSGADLISFGMGEHSILEIAQALDSGLGISDLTFIAGTVYRSKSYDHVLDPVLLPSYEEVCSSKKKYVESFSVQYKNQDPFSGKVLVEPYERQGYVIANPPAKPLTEMEMDDVYDYPYTRELPDIPAVREIQFSLSINRGCFGGCNFCALAYHQGRIVQNRSKASILKEARAYTKDPSFKGYIHDVGGPTADFMHPACEKQMTKGVCTNRQCLVPSPCKNLNPSHKEYVSLLRDLRKIPGVKKVFIRSGIRFDYVLQDKDDTFLKELVQYHISGQLRVAPEHVSDQVLCYMGKPNHKVYTEFLDRFNRLNEACHLKQYAVPYFMSSHPGCTLKDAVALAEYIRDIGFMPEQVQDFYPTPGTISTCMYYTEIDPLTGKKIYVPKNPHEKAMQRALIQYRNPNNYELVLEALKKADRMDLVGFGPKCLIRPKRNSVIRQKDIEKNRSGRKKEPVRSEKKKKAIRNVHKKKH